MQEERQDIIREADYLRILDASNVMLLVVDRSLAVVHANGKAVESFLGQDGIPRDVESLLGEPLMTFLKDQNLVDWVGQVVAHLDEEPGSSVKEQIVLVHGTSKFYLDFNAFPVSGAGGLTGLVFRDVYYEKKLLKQLQQAEDLFTFKEVLLGASNELNNLMTVISMYSSMLLGGDKLPPEEKERFARVSQETARAKDIVANLLLLAMEKQESLRSIDLNLLVKAVVKMRQYEINVSNLRIEMKLDEQIPLLAGDPHRLHQLILNLINHCLHSILSSNITGQITVETKYQAESVILSVSDTAPHFSEEDLAQLFDPFYTPRTGERRSSMGLNLCKRVVEEHGGEIQVFNLDPRGVRFYCVFPLVDTSQLNPATSRIFLRSPRMKATPGKGRAIYEKVMVVDDEEGIRLVLSNVLEAMGMKVVTCDDGRQAMRMLVMEKPDAIISDIRMPFVGGKTLFNAIVKVNPHLAANTLFITGDAVRTDSQKFLDENSLPFLHKPFGMEDVEKALDFLAETAEFRLHNILQKRAAAPSADDNPDETPPS